MTESEIRRVVSEAVRETLRTMGFDIEDMHEVQRDVVFLRSTREAADSVKQASLWAVAGTIVTGILGLIIAKLTGKI